MSVFENPKPCPKCSNDSVSVEYEDEGSVCEFVTCDDCGYQVKRRYAGNGVAYWNKLKRKYDLASIVSRGEQDDEN